MRCVAARGGRSEESHGDCALARFGYIAASGMVDMRAAKGVAGVQGRRAGVGAGRSAARVERKVRTSERREEKESGGSKRNERVVWGWEWRRRNGETKRREGKRVVACREAQRRRERAAGGSIHPSAAFFSRRVRLARPHGGSRRRSLGHVGFGLPRSPSVAEKAVIGFAAENILRRHRRVFFSSHTHRLLSLFLSRRTLSSTGCHDY